MRIAFFGSPPFAARMLSEVASAGHDIAVVYTQPEKQRGRGRSVRPTPVQDMAERLGLPVRTPASMRAEGERIAFQALKLDAAIVVAYGQILRRDILDAPRLGCFNLHASLLPRWRGAAPIQRAIMAGDAVTGVQVMRMTEGLDEGPVLSTATVPIEPDDTAGSLHDKLMEAAARLLPQTLRAIENGEARETPQPSSGATYARKIAVDETRIDWTASAVDLDRRIRGLSPHPGAWFELPTAKGLARVKVLSCRIGLGEGAPGEILDDALLVACGQGALRLLRLQREGRTAQDADDFLRGVATDTLLQLS